MDLVVWLILGVVLAHLLLDIARWFLDSQRVAYWRRQRKRRN